MPVSDPPPSPASSAPPPAVQAAIGLGGNLGDPLSALPRAWQALGRQAGIRLLALSRPWASAPVDMESDRDFVNAAGIIETRLAPRVLLGILKKMEQDFGRAPRSGPAHEDRPLDLDLLFYGSQVLDGPDLVLPHARMHLRRFVLEPLRELAPRWTHPRLGRDVADLARDLAARAASQQPVRPLDWP